MRLSELFRVETGHLITPSVAICQSLLSTHPRTLHSLKSSYQLFSPPCHYIAADCHPVYSHSNQSLDLRVFPYGTIVDSFQGVGNVICESYRESDTTISACVTTWRRQRFILFGSFNSDLAYSRVADRPQNICTGRFNDCAAAFTNRLEYFTCTPEGIEAVASLDSPCGSIGGLAVSEHGFLFGQPSGYVHLWDTRASKSVQLFKANHEQLQVSSLKVAENEVYTTCNFISKDGLLSWDWRYAHIPSRKYKLPRFGTRLRMDVDIRAGILVGSVGNEVWLWNCWKGGEPLGGWVFPNTHVLKLALVGWGGSKGGIFIDEENDKHYIPLGGWVD